MCTAVYIDGRPYETRDALESKLGMKLPDDIPRSDKDHCLCAYDLPAILVYRGYAVRLCRDGDAGMAGDLYAESDQRPSA